MQYAVDFFDQGNGARPPKAKVSEHGNAIWVNKDFFKPNRIYSFVCRA